MAARQLINATVPARMMYVLAPSGHIRHVKWAPNIGGNQSILTVEAGRIRIRLRFADMGYKMYKDTCTDDQWRVWNEFCDAAKRKLTKGVFPMGWRSELSQKRLNNADTNLPQIYEPPTVPEELFDDSGSQTRPDAEEAGLASGESAGSARDSQTEEIGTPTWTPPDVRLSDSHTQPRGSSPQVAGGDSDV